MSLLGCPITLSETPWQQRLRPPAVGERTREVLQRCSMTLDWPPGEGGCA